MHPAHKLYVIVPFGDDIVHQQFYAQAHIVRDWIIHPCADGINHVGVVVPAIWEFKQKFGSVAGVHILPRVHDPSPLPTAVATILAYCGVLPTDTMRQAAYKLCSYHGHCSLDPDID